MPSDNNNQTWLDNALSEVAGPKSPLLPIIQDFKSFIENNGEMYKGFHEMFEGATDPFPKDYQTLLLLFNKVIQEAPTFGDLGPPIYMIISQTMNTRAGFTVFLSTELNKQFKKMFEVWANFLLSEESRYVLNTGRGGWFSDEALKAMDKHFNKGFQNTFVCNPDAPYWGFTSWDNFFNRTLKSDVRTLELPDNPNIINAACESQVYNIARAVKVFDTFWVKGEPYSLIHMLNHDPDYLREFISGTVFQGFLEVTAYHRWHSPVTGIIRKIVHVEGTYFVQSPALLGDPSVLQGATDAPPYLRSLAFISSINTRALIFIESSNPLIGLMCFVAIGMTEVSTCEVTVKVDQEISRGDQLGMFHFGGSSHVLVFRAGTNITFFDGYDKCGDHVKVRAAIAGVA